MRRWGLLLFGASIAAMNPPGAFGASWEGSKAYQACVDAAKEVDSVIARCGQDEFDRQDKAMNAAYAARLKSSDDTLKRAIVKAQNAWLAARDPTCDAESAVYAGGTLAPVAYTACEARLTIERIKWLTSLDH